MSLPKGFNPNKMTFGNITKSDPIIEIPRNTSIYSTPHVNNRLVDHDSLWSRFNRGVAGIGNWFAEKTEDVLGWISLIITVVIIISCVVKIINTWIDDGFWMALLMAIGVCIGGVIAWYIAAFAIFISVNIVMYGLRFLFWNGWTLLIGFILAGTIWFWMISPYNQSSYNKSVQIETVIHDAKTYRCTAKLLNVREAPNTNSNIIGTIQRGQTVEVYDDSNNFGRIIYNGRTGYVSFKYLKPINKH